MINVTKTFLPPFEEYTAMLKRAWDLSWITNNGVLLLELEEKLKEYLSVSNLLFSANGTVVLQMALKVLGVTKEVITTPFSYVATTNTILWEGCKPVFVDIDPLTLCIDSDKIEQAVTKNTQAILATHVYGIPCDLKKIEAIAKKHDIKVIYDGAHAFGCEVNGKSLLDYGDISTCSFHATKVFHTVEGGCIICHDKQLNDMLILSRSFGHIGDDHYAIGINGKNSEFHAAMGLVNLKYIDINIEKRRQLSKTYDKMWSGYNIMRPSIPADIRYNYSYYPIILESEKILLAVISALKKISVFPRRYFFPTLNELPQTKYLGHKCPVSEDVSTRVLCLPLYPDLSNRDIVSIANIVKQALK